MRIPKNKIVTGKYTSGNEFVEKLSNLPYQGYYYELNNKFYTGKEYNANAVEIIKIQQQNQLYNLSFDTALFSFISGITSQALQSPKVSGVPVSPLSIVGSFNTTRFFSQKINVQPITIKEINEETYNSLQGNSLFITTFISPTQTVDQADKQMPGLKNWLLG
jgi:hypothetical protein